MKYSLDHKSPVPLHAQAEELLRKMAGQKEYREGKFLPNEVALAGQLGISRNTLRQAASKLVYEGILVRKKGIGTRFAGPVVDSRARNWSSFSQEMEAKGIKVKNYEITTGWVTPEEQVALFLGIPVARKVMQLVRLRGTEQGPFVYFISWFHPRIGLTGREDFTRPLYEILEKDYATPVRTSKEEITACAADAALARKLRIGEGRPILKRKRLVYDPGNRPVEYNVGYYRGDSFTYTIESERES
jgi:GntR family transcriptional regulator